MATDQGRLKLVATDLEIAITCWIGAQVEEEGAITVPARLLTDFVTSLPNERSTSRCRRAPPAEPQLRPQRGPDRRHGRGRLPARAAGRRRPPAEARRQGASSAPSSRSSSPPPPTTRGPSSPASTPWPRTRSSPWPPPTASGSPSTSSPLGQEVPEKVEVIIPARALRELMRLLGDEEEPLEMAFNAARSQVLFRMKTVELVATLIQGTFPNYSQLIPASPTPPAPSSTCGSSCRRRASPPSSPATAPASCASRSSPARTGAGQDDHLRPRRGDRRHRGEMDVKIEGEASKIAFNSKYLQDVLRCWTAPGGAGDHQPLQPRRHPPRRHGRLRPRRHADVRPVVAGPLRDRAL